MLIYNSRDGTFLWDEQFDLDDPENALCVDATEIFWCVVVARDQGVEVPEVERHLQYLRDAGAADDLPTDDTTNPYWNDL